VAEPEKARVLWRSFLQSVGLIEIAFEIGFDEIKEVASDQDVVAQRTDQPADLDRLARSDVALAELGRRARLSYQVKVRIDRLNAPLLRMR